MKKNIKAISEGMAKQTNYLRTKLFELLDIQENTATESEVRFQFNVLLDDIYGYDKFDPENIPDEACWNTEAVALTRHEVYNTAKRREYNYGREGIDWRIYGVPAVGIMTEKLASTGVNQEYIDAEVEVYKKDRKEWEK